MPLNYTWITFAQAKAQLANLLNDPPSSSPGGVGFYSNTELGVYIVEALRYWNSLTNFYRDRASFQTSTGGDNPWYDLPTFVPQQRAYNVTDSEMMQQIEYSLLEPPSIPYAGSSQFDQPTIVTAMERRRNQFLLETATVLTHMQINPPAPPVGRVALPDNVIYVRRAGWLHVATQVWTTLPRSDEWFLLNYYQPAWTQQVVEKPQVYSVAVTPPLTLQLAPPPNDIGVLDLVVVTAGSTLNPNQGTLLGIPDDLAWVVKFGALADILGADGPAKDPLRSQYCQSRWEEGLTLARIAKSVLFLYVDGAPAYSESLQSIDSTRDYWQNYFGQPVEIGAMSGLNLLAMVNPPATTHSVTLDIVTNAIVPVADGDFIQLGREEFAAVLGYAEHLATFKCGGAEFTQSMQRHRSLIDLGLSYNLKLAAITQPALTDRSLIEKSQRPAMLQRI